MLKAVSFFKVFGNVQKVGSSVIKDQCLLLQELPIVKLPCRTTFVLRRKYPVPLVKKTADLDTWKLKKRRHLIYEIEHRTENLPESEINVILTSYVQGLGDKDDILSVKRTFAYEKLLIPGLAEYATPEALEKAKLNAEKSGKSVKAERKYSSKDVQRTMNVLSSKIIGITMNKENKWTLEPWHVRSAFRKAGVHLNENCIEMPKEKIEGPDINLESKEFFVTVTINKREKVKVRCRLHHWSTDILDRLPVVVHHWALPAEPLFKDEAEALSNIPLPPLPKQSTKITY